MKGTGYWYVMFHTTCQIPNRRMRYKPARARAEKLVKPVSYFHTFCQDFICGESITRHFKN